MLVVKVEVWPGGYKDLAYEVGNLKAANVSSRANISDYSYVIESEAYEELKLPKLRRSGRVLKYKRAQSPWALVQKILNNAYPSKVDKNAS